VTIAITETIATTTEAVIMTRTPNPTFSMTVPDSLPITYSMMSSLLFSIEMEITTKILRDLKKRMLEETT